MHHTSQHQRARRPARPLWPHLWLAKKLIAMAEYSGSSYYNSLKSGETSVQWLFSYWWPILEWRQGKIQLWNDSLAAHRAQTHLHLCMYLMSGQRVTVMISELNFALSSLEYRSSIREKPLHWSFPTFQRVIIAGSTVLCHCDQLFCQPKVWPEWVSRAACSLMLGSVMYRRFYVYTNQCVFVLMLSMSFVGFY